MPKFAVYGKYVPSVGLDGRATRADGQNISLNTNMATPDMVRTESNNLNGRNTVKALTDLYATDLSVDPLAERLGGPVLDYDVQAFVNPPVAYWPLKVASGEPINLGTASFPTVTTGVAYAQASLQAADPSALSMGFSNGTLGNVASTAATAPAAVAFTGLQDMSVSFWMNITAMPGSLWLVGTRAAGNNTGWLVSLTSGGALAYTRYGAGQGVGSQSSAGAIVAGTTYHVGVSYDSVANMSRVYINGLLVKTTSYAATLPGGIDAPLDPFRIGGYSTGTTPSGRISNVAIYNVALPHWQFRAQWASGQYGSA